MKDSKRRSAPRSERAASDPRRERLKHALRENLKRRKLQMRERGDFTQPSPASDELARNDDGAAVSPDK